ncbi:hypothetical protein BGZ96_003922 [Linnemannia gamsii]|uniref:HCP-like protein n=1 Tax=Linnemannia gamsii TaxID=64522 RepID=A0ABQ7KF60_9FUNG|nr:hypothetical protein BGZ96_003922 [Linnemannia gamsii]
MTLKEPENQTEERVQAIRPVYKTGSSSSTNIVSDSEVLHVVIYLDPAGREIVIWEDILSAYKDALNVRQGSYVLPFLRGSDYMLIEPHCIAAVPDAVLDVHIGEPIVQQDTTLIITLAALQSALQVVSQSAVQSPPSQSSTQPVSLSEETVQDLGRSVASAFSKEFDVISKSHSAPVQSSNNNTRNTEVRTRNRTNDNSLTQAWPSGNTLRQQRRQSSIQDNISTNSLDSADESRSQVLYSAVDEDTTPPSVSVLSQFSQCPMVRRDDSYIQSISHDIARDQVNPDDGNTKDAGDSIKDNVPPVTPSYQLEQQAVLDSNLNTMSKLLRSLAAQAGQEEVESQYKLARAYEEGSEGLSRSDESAIEWYLKAANRGHLKSQIRVAKYYDEGFSVPKDCTIAFEWYMKAASRRNKLAQLRIAQMSTSVVESSRIRAKPWSGISEQPTLGAP